MDMGLFVFLWAVLAASCALFTATAAEGKGYKESSWGVVGLLFGPLGLLAIAACPDLRTRRLLRVIAENQSASGDKLKAFDAPPLEHSNDGGMLGTMVESLLKPNRD